MAQRWFSSLEGSWLRDMTLSRIDGTWSDVPARVPLCTRRAPVGIGDRLKTYREDHGASDVADSVGFFVESGARVDNVVMGHSDAGPQNHLHKRPTVTGLDHGPTRLVDVPGDHNAGPGRLRQELKHVALGQRGHQELLRVPPGRVSAEGRVCSPWDCRLGLPSHIVVPGVGRITCGPLPKVPGPDHRRPIVMPVACHAQSPSFGWIVARASAKKSANTRYAAAFGWNRSSANNSGQDTGGIAR